MKKIFALIFIFVLSASCAWARSDVTLAELNGTVGVQMEEFVKEVIANSENNGDALIIFQLDTPGGLVESMRGVVQSILASKVPVAVWIPPGGRAASAGAFIVQSAHVAAMAPGTNIGAAHPVVASGEDIKESDMSKKIMNDLKAQMRSVVQLRGRNQEITEKMIEESISLTATEALKNKVIDVIAGDVNSLIKAISGRRVKIGSNFVKINFDKEVKVSKAAMSFSEKIIQFVSDPQIAYLLISGGIMAIFFEIITPGGFMLGTAGGVMLVLGSIGLKMLPFNWAGIVLIIAGIILMIIDLTAGTSGVLTLLGLPVFCLGGVFLFRAPGGELLQVSMSVIVGIALALGICFAFMAYLILKGFRRKVSTGQSGMIGLNVEIISDLSEKNFGQVSCHGEIWRAKTESGNLAAGSSGTVKAVDGMTLIIE
ncbi:MAG: nodulation protein NfeD [Synergistales bacterium]|nr:nodulation protein NfeD [Synergistales bacterium]MDY6401118.1 nodulation protein NfeD [Synergistales bacterium]MDY6404711.1 nodulation protein NfeD [Synergistales bacterium]MDY6410863.1 nodulation protein NfeD [Synergistales bacterium]MDY6415156.1 nodulation protein NfeD [Synergistales bacterium]